MKSSLFLSHNHNDKSFVRRIAGDLRSEGVTVWIDDAEIKLGDSLIKKIEEGINGAEYLAVILSPNSIGSEWVQRELRTSITQEIAGNTVKVLPLLYRDCEMPAFLIDKMYADFRDENNYETSLNLLLQRLGVVTNEAFSDNPKSETLRVLTLALECWYSEDDEFFKLHRPDISAIHINSVSCCLLSYEIVETKSLPAEHPNATGKELLNLKPIAYRYRFLVTLTTCDRPQTSSSIVELRRLAPGRKSWVAEYNVTRFTDGSWLVMTDVDG